MRRSSRAAVPFINIVDEDEEESLNLTLLNNNRDNIVNQRQEEQALIFSNTKPSASETLKEQEVEEKRGLEAVKKDHRRLQRRQESPLRRPQFLNGLGPGPTPGTGTRRGSPLKLVFKNWIKTRNDRKMLETCTNLEPGVYEFEDNVLFDTDSPVWILGQRYNARSGGTGVVSDEGWGCMLRCGQMLLAETMIRHHLGRQWRWSLYESEDPASVGYKRILRMFLDKKDRLFSLQQIAQMGVTEGKEIGEWFGPNTAAQALKKLAIYDDWTRLAVHVAMDNTLILQDIYRLAPFLPPCQTTAATTMSSSITATHPSAAVSTNTSDPPTMTGMPKTEDSDEPPDAPEDTTKSSLEPHSVIEHSYKKKPVSSPSPPSYGHRQSQQPEEVINPPPDNDPSAAAEPPSDEQFDAPMNPMSSPSPVVINDTKSAEAFEDGEEEENAKEENDSKTGNAALQDSTTSIEDIDPMFSNTAEEELPADSSTTTKSTDRVSPACGEGGTRGDTDAVRQGETDDGDKEDNRPWRPLLLIIPLRLGLTSLNPCYIGALKAFLTMDECVGILGGRPNHALYVIGFVDNQILYLDPHTCQNRVEEVGEAEGDDSSFHCGHILSQCITGLDPSLALAFYVSSKAEFEQLVSSLRQKLLLQSQPALFEILDARPRSWPEFVPYAGVDAGSLGAGVQSPQFEHIDPKFDSDEEFEILDS